jgi:hypothetical protein
MTTALPQNCGLFTRTVSGKAMSSESFQVRFHPKLGVVIYDPVAQMGINKDQLRLFKINSMSATTFRRDIVNKDLGVCEADVMQDSAISVDAYRLARVSRRKPYCESCRRHFGSVDFSVCTDCNSVRCACGTRSCTSRKRKAA